jgi:hypothetical protein
MRVPATENSINKSLNHTHPSNPGAESEFLKRTLATLTSALEYLDSPIVKMVSLCFKRSECAGRA